MKILSIYQSIKKFFSLLSSKEKAKFKLLIFMSVLAAFAELASLGLIYPLMIAILDPEALSTNNQISYFLEEYSPFRGNNFIVFAVVLVCIGFIFKTVFLIYYNWFRNYYLNNLSNNMGVELFKTYLSASYEFHSRSNSSTILRNMVSQVKILKDTFIVPLGYIIETFIVGVPLAAFLIYLDWFSFIFILITISLPSAIYLKIFSVKSKLRSEFTQQAQFKKNNIVIESLASIKETKALKKGLFFLKQYQKSAEIEANAMAYHESVAITPRYFIETVAVISVVVVMSVMLLNGYPSSEIVTYMSIFGFAALRLLPLCFQLIHSLQSLAFGQPVLDVIHKDLKGFKKSDLESLEEDKKDFVFNKTIELKDVVFNYTSEDQVSSHLNILKRVSFTIKKNQSVAFVGSTGAGKTTLVDVIIGLLKIESGSIKVDGVEVTNQKIWTSKIGYVPQSISLMDTSIRENIAFGVLKEEIDDRRISEVIKIAQLEDFVATLPDKVETKIGERGVQLSGGQRQRISIARALYHRPEILVMDEATSALDNLTEKLLVQTLKELQGRLTVIVIAHRFSTVEHSDNIFFLEKGRIVESGTFSELKRKSKSFKTLTEANSK